MTINEFFAKNPRCALALSGGVDSSYLLYEGLRCGADIRPYFIKTSFVPEFELRDALKLCETLGVELSVITLDILAVPFVKENPSDRCYYCKRALFDSLVAQAAADGYTTVIDGTNASDDTGDRPGVRALFELNVRSPLLECKIDKAQIRRRSREAGLFSWDKPAYACLATRVPTGTEIDTELLGAIERAESALCHMGFSDLRVRVLKYAGDATRTGAKIQLPDSQLDAALTRRADIVEALSPRFSEILLDLKGR